MTYDQADELAEQTASEVIERAKANVPDLNKGLSDVELRGLLVDAMLTFFQKMK